jgi:hypothetical protein
MKDVLFALAREISRGHAEDEDPDSDATGHWQP